MHGFIKRVRARLNKGIALNTLFLTVLAVSVLVIIIGLVYVIRGYDVSNWVFYSGFGLLVVLWPALWFTRRKNMQQAAVYTDSHFKLKDSIISSLEFEKKEEHKYKALQYAQTQKKLEGLNTSDVPLSISRKMLVASLVGTVVAVSLSFVPPSDAVLKKQEDERLMTVRTTELKKKVEEVVEEMLEDMSEEEKALIDTDEIRKWVKDLKPTAKEREAMLNIARVKQEIQKKIAGLENRKNEALLKAAGLKLQKSSNSKAKHTGDAMSQKDFEAIKKALEDFKLGKDKEKEAKKATKDLLDKLKDAKELTDEEKEKLAEMLKQKLGDVRELAKRMAEAAQEGDFGEEGQGEDFDFDLNDLPEGIDLDQLMELLNQHAMEMQDFMDGQMLEGEPMTDEEMREFMEMLEEMDEGLEEMQGEMQEMDARRMLRKRLEALRKGLGKGLGKGLSKSKGPRFNMPGQSGKKPGTGTDSSRRNEKDEDIDNKNLSKIKGQQGKGPVGKKTEAADSGTGTSYRKGSASKRSYEHQMSSYLDRDDIPEDVKQAMRQYYQDIHQIGEAQK